MKYILPLVIFFCFSVILGIGLNLKPKEIPSALIGKKIHDFELPPLEGKNNGFSSSDLKIGKPILVNVFASWCGPCRQEHPLLMELAKKNKFVIYGINHRDNPTNAKNWLNAYGDPYKLIGADLSGRESINWGIYGVPETFVIDEEGCIQYKHISPITRQVLEKEILPRLNGRKKINCTD